MAAVWDDAFAAGWVVTVSYAEAAGTFCYGFMGPRGKTSKGFLELLLWLQRAADACTTLGCPRPPRAPNCCCEECWAKVQEMVERFAQTTPVLDEEQVRYQTELKVKLLGRHG